MQVRGMRCLGTFGMYLKQLSNIVMPFLSVLFLASIAHGQFANSVDPLLGASGGGNVFPGPAVPFGMIKPGPDMVASGENDSNAGWNADGDIRGFSQTHVSGTGGGAKYGNILVQPTTGDPSPLDSQSPRADEQASAGLYSVKLARYGIGVDITSAHRAAIYRFRYPQTTHANLLFDVSHCLIGVKAYGESQSLVASEIQVLSPTEVAGSSSVTGGGNKQPNAHTLYFYARTDTPAASWGTWLDGNLQPDSKSVSGPAKTNAGAWLTFAAEAARPVFMKISISFISIEQARRNLASEIPGFDFAATHAGAMAEWNRAL